MFKKNLMLTGLFALLLSVNTTVGAANVVSDFNTGIDGWQSTDGNGSISYFSDGYITVADDTSGHLHAIAPDKFHGDWSKYDSVSADFLANYSTTHNRYVSFKISDGKGNQAVYDFPVSVLPRNWHTLSLDIDQSVWNVTAGSWNKLITDVSDFRIALDLQYGMDEATGLDNVILTGATPVPEPSSMALGLLSIGGLIASRIKKA